MTPKKIHSTIRSYLKKVNYPGIISIRVRKHQEGFLVVIDGLCFMDSAERVLADCSIDSNYISPSLAMVIKEEE